MNLKKIWIQNLRNGTLFWKKLKRLRSMHIIIVIGLSNILYKGIESLINLSLEQIAMRHHHEGHWQKGECLKLRGSTVDCQKYSHL